MTENECVLLWLGVRMESVLLTVFGCLDCMRVC